MKLKPKKRLAVQALINLQYAARDQNSRAMLDIRTEATHLIDAIIAAVVEEMKDQDKK